MNNNSSRPKVSKPELVVKCPNCNNSVAWQLNKHKPFCSERCKMLDLGAWANEEHSISDEVSNKDFSDESLTEEI